jgi:KRAB domain-containing zinc finger protein
MVSEACKDSHSVEKLYKCKQCGEAVRRLIYVQICAKLHAREKVCMCKQCGKGFMTVTNFHKHMVTHTGGGPFECKVHSKAFGWASALERHE